MANWEAKMKEAAKPVKKDWEVLTGVKVAPKDITNPAPQINYENEKDIFDMKVPYTGIADSVKLLGGLSLDNRPESQVNLLKEYVPGIESDFDDEGHSFVTYEGKKYYINKPGASGSDLTSFMADIAAFLPASKVAALGKTALARFGIGAATYGASSTASDLGANALGSKNGIDPIKAGVAAAFGGLAEAFTPFVMQGVRRLFGSKKLFNVATGLTERGKAMVKDLGFDPESFNPEAAREFSRLIDGSIEPKVAASVAENKGFGIRTTKGEATQDFNLLQKEDLARKGGFGERAQQKMQVFDDAKTGEMLTARDTMQGEIAGGAPNISREVEGAGVIAEGIKNKAKQQSAIVSEAYEEAARYEARLSIESLKELSQNIQTTFRQSSRLVDKTLTPSTNRAFKDIAAISKQGKNVKITAVTIKRLEALRRKLGHLIDAGANKTDKGNVSVIKQELDNWLDSAFDRALFEGDEQALNALKTARSARKRYGDFFQKRGKGDVAGGELEKIIGFDADETQTLSYLFGKGKLGGKDGANKIAVRVKEVLGEDSTQWHAFKETAFLRLLKNTAKTHNGKTTFNGQAFVRNFDAAMNDAPGLMKTIFGDGLPKLKGFRGAVDRATFRPEGSVNHSGTGVAISKIAQESFGRFAQIMGLTGDLTSYVLINGVSKAVGKVGKDFTKGVKPSLPSSGFAATLAAAGVNASREGVSRSRSPRQSANTRTSPETKRSK